MFEGFFVIYVISSPSYISATNNGYLTSQKSKNLTLKRHYFLPTNLYCGLKSEKNCNLGKLHCLPQRLKSMFFWKSFLTEWPWRRQKKPFDFSLWGTFFLFLSPLVQRHFSGKIKKKIGTYLTAEIDVSIIARRAMPARKFSICLFATRQFSFIAATANSVERPAVAILGNMPTMLCPTGLTVPAMLCPFGLLTAWFWRQVNRAPLTLGHGLTGGAILFW